jgi:hypothetical protein
MQGVLQNFKRLKVLKFPMQIISSFFQHPQMIITGKYWDVLPDHSMNLASMAPEDVSCIILGLENREYGPRDPSRLPRCTLYPQKLALTSPTSGGCSVGIIRSRTKGHGVYPQ